MRRAAANFTRLVLAPLALLGAFACADRPASPTPPLLRTPPRPPVRSTRVPTLPPPTSGLPTATSAPLTGITGDVSLGPTCGGGVCAGPGCPAPESCFASFPATITILSASGQPATSLRTDAQGHFQILLPPATYTLVVVPLDTKAGLNPGQPLTEIVTIVDGALSPVRIVFNTGMA